LEFVKEFDLEEDETEEIDGEIESVEKAWKSLFGSVEASVNIDSPQEFQKENNKFDLVMTKLGTTYSEEEHGARLQELSNKHGKQLTIDVFLDWYISWLYKPEDEEDEEEEDRKEQGEKKQLR
jgi:hypothetical protein